jgi:hypothetical protein
LCLPRLFFFSVVCCLPTSVISNAKLQERHFHLLVFTTVHQNIFLLNKLLFKLCTSTIRISVIILHLYYSHTASNHNGSNYCRLALFGFD